MEVVYSIHNDMVNVFLFVEKQRQVMILQDGDL